MLCHYCKCGPGSREYEQSGACVWVGGLCLRTYFPKGLGCWLCFSKGLGQGGGHPGILPQHTRCPPACTLLLFSLFGLLVPQL